MKKQAIFLMATLWVGANLYSQKAEVSYLEEMVYELASDSYKGRGFGSKEGLKAAQYIAGQFEKNGVDPFFKEYLVPFQARAGVINPAGNNVVAWIEGSSPELKEEYIVLGAHYDHLGWEFDEGDSVIYNGADDNASGVASIIEIARLLQQEKEWLGRSVLFIAFDGEESGLLGSKAFVKEFILADEDPAIDPSQVVAMFSLDMVGMYEAHNGIELLGFELFSDHEQILADALSDAFIEVNHTDGTIQRRTDTGPFARAGIPSVHVFTGMESPYHKPGDDADLLDYQGMAKVVDFMQTLVQELSTIPEIRKDKLLEGTAERGPMKIFNPGIHMNLGSSHHDFKNDFRKAKPVFSASAGLFFETRITQWLAFQPEVVYSLAGSQSAAGKLYTHNVMVPMSFLFTTPDEGFGVRAYYQIGGYYNYSFAGNDGGAALDFGTQYNQEDYGIIFGAGFEMMNFRIGFVSVLSSMDFILNDSPDVDARLSGSYARIGWAF